MKLTAATNRSEHITVFHKGEPIVIIHVAGHSTMPDVLNRYAEWCGLERRHLTGAWMNLIEAEDGQ